MEIPSSEAISFNRFYLIEFFKLTLEKIKDKVAQEHYDTLEQLCTYLLKEETIIEGLEKVARYQNTNDLAIFLFDMIERANDYGPKVVYNTLPDLAEDFLNLYSLMVEDGETVVVMNNVVADFDEKYGKKPEKVDPAKEKEEKAKTVESDEINFKAFYSMEMATLLKDKVGAEEHAAYKILLKNYAHSEGQSDIPAEIFTIQEEIRKRTQFSNTSFVSLYEQIATHANEIALHLTKLKTEHKAAFTHFVENERFPVAEAKPIAQKEKQDLNTLLVDYFKSVVVEHTSEIKEYVRNLAESDYNVENIKELQKKVRSFKEISMIHGYTGLEHLLQLLATSLNSLLQSNKQTSAPSYTLLDELAEGFLVAEKLQSKQNDSSYVGTLEQKIDALTQSYSVADKTTTEQKVEPLPSDVDNETVKLFAWGDEEVNQALTESYVLLIKALGSTHKPYMEQGEKSEIDSLLSLLGKNTSFFNPKFAGEVIPAINAAYLRAKKADKLESLNEILALLTEHSTVFNKSENNNVLAQALNGIGSDEEELIAVDARETEEAFAQATQAAWHAVKDKFVPALTGKVENKDILGFYAHLEENLKLLGYETYLAYSGFVKEQIKNAETHTADSEWASELERSMSLFLDRIKSQGKSGNCMDIVSALDDVYSDLQQTDTLEEAYRKAEIEADLEEKASEPATEQQNEAEQEADDDRSLFIQESQEALKIINAALDDFSADFDRTHLNKVENAVHAVRTSAHFLGFADISKLAATIEEVAEIFGQSAFTFPKELDKTLKDAVATLEQMIESGEGDFANHIQNLESIIDNLVIEDVGATEKSDFDFDQEKEADETKKSKPAVEEKPLFSADSDDDDELKEIFEEESTTFLNNISIANEHLRLNANDVETMSKMGYAAHSLRSAAKMMGHTHISQLTDSVEKVTEALKENEIVYNIGVAEKIDKAVDVLTKLCQNKEVASELISEVVKELEIENLPTDEKKTVKVEEKSTDSVSENMINIFVDEARELVEALNSDYIGLDKMPDSEMILQNILRRLHTLKGSSYVTQLNLLGDLAHKMEDFFSLYSENDANIKHDMINVAFVAHDIMHDMVENIANGDGEEIDKLTVRMAEIDNKIFAFQNLGAAGIEGAEQIPELIASQPEDVAPAASNEDANLKISTQYMDKLVDMASELMINQTQLGSHLQALKEVLRTVEGEKKQIHGADNVLEDILETSLERNEGTNEENSGNQEEIDKATTKVKGAVSAVNLVYKELNKLTEGFEQNIGRLSHISKLLHSDMLKTRMVPVDNLFNRYPRAVRDLAQKQRKKVNLIIEGNNTELDRAMVEGLSEPLLHIIRNAVDHGIETPRKRKLKDKNEEATLILKARQEKNQIVIEVEDDGRGIDIEKVRKKIVKLELADKETVERMSEAEILDYIFYAGFTTKERATKVSGRGVGLDAVATQVQKLKGNIRIKTEADRGTSFSLRVPLTLVISHALMVKVEQQSVAIPVIAIQESIKFSSEDVISDDSKQYIRLRGRLLPFIHLKDILKFEGETKKMSASSEQMAVIIYDAGITIVLGIDELIGRQEVVIKNLGSHLQNVDYISGGTILGNGEVALILDYAMVIRTMEVHYFGKVHERLAAKSTARQIEAADPATEQEKKPKSETKAKAKPKPKPKPKAKAAAKAQKEPDVKADKVDETKSEVIGSSEVKLKRIKSRKPKIIIVDDSNSVRNFVGSILERNGFLVIKSTNGADAIEKMKTEKVDLMITDLEMPKMHGFDLISHIRSEKKYNSLPIIILTGRAGMKHRKTGEELGANAFIVKPFKEKDLLGSLAEFIEKKE